MGNGIKSYYFAIVLYDDDPAHVQIIKYLRTCPLWLDFFVLICHDKDVVEPIRYSKSEAEIDVEMPLALMKKRHYHVLLRLRCRTHLKAFLNLFKMRADKQAVQYALAVDNPFAYVTYMVHADFKSLSDDRKYKYKMEDLIWSQGAEKILDAQNRYFVQYFKDIMFRLRDGENLFDIIDSALSDLPSLEAQEYVRIVQKFQYLFIQRGFQLSLEKFKNSGGK